MGVNLGCRIAHLLVRRKCVFDEPLDLGVYHFGVDSGELVVHPTVRLIVPLGYRLPQPIRLVVLLLGLGEIFVTVVSFFQDWPGLVGFGWVMLTKAD